MNSYQKLVAIHDNEVTHTCTQLRKEYEHNWGRRALSGFLEVAESALGDISPDGYADLIPLSEDTKPFIFVQKMSFPSIREQYRNRQKTLGYVQFVHSFVVSLSVSASVHSTVFLEIRFRYEYTDGTWRLLAVAPAHSDMS